MSQCDILPLSLLFSLLPVRIPKTFCCPPRGLMCAYSLQKANEEMGERLPSYLDTGYALGVVLLFISKLGQNL